MVGTGLYNDCVSYRLSVVVIPTIIGDPNKDYADLSAYLMYRLVPLTLDVIKEYQMGERVPGGVPPFPKPDPPPAQDYLYQAACLAYKLNIRRGPNSRYSLCGHLRSGDEVKVYNLVDGWAAIDKLELEWVYARYLKKVP